MNTIFKLNDLANAKRVKYQELKAGDFFVCDNHLAHKNDVYLMLDPSREAAGQCLYVYTPAGNFAGRREWWVPSNQNTDYIILNITASAPDAEHSKPAEAERKLTVGEL